MNSPSPFTEASAWEAPADGARRIPAPAQPSLRALTRLQLRSSAVLPVVFLLVALAQILFPVVILLAVDGEDARTVTFVDSALFTWAVILLVSGIVEASSQTRLLATAGATRVRHAASAWLSTALLTVGVAAICVVATALSQAWGGSLWNTWSDSGEVRAAGVVLALADHPAATILPAAALLAAVASAGRLIGSAFREWAPWAAIPAIIPAVAPVIPSAAWYYAAGSTGGLWSMWGAPTWWVPALVVVQTGAAWLSQTRGALSTAA
jgi:hypothetical protein